MFIRMLIINSKKIYFELCLLLSLLFFLASCNTCTNLNNKEPYIEAIGKKFVLQQDYYIFKFIDRNDLILGKVAQLPNDIDSKYIGSKFSNLKIIGIVKLGQLFQIEEIIRKQTIEDSYYNYYIVLQSLDHAYSYKVNASLLCNTMENPPFKKTWSDPPIFESNAALPLPSDGIWWK